LTGLRLGDDIGDQHILEHRDLILETQLALLDSGDLELVDSGRRHQRFDGGVEIAMLLPENLDSSRNDFTVQTTRSNPEMLRGF